MSLAVKELNEILRRQTWLDQLAKPLQKAVSGFYQQTGKAGSLLANFFNGSWLGHPLHPVITDVPIGSWIAAIVLDQVDEQGVPCIACPWHGSTFAMDSGRVVHGPSAYPQPSFETRILNGQVEVRLQ